MSTNFPQVVIPENFYFIGPKVERKMISLFSPILVLLNPNIFREGRLAIHSMSTYHKYLNFSESFALIIIIIILLIIIYVLMISKIGTGRKHS